MRKFFLILFLTSSFAFDALAQIVRSTSFDERPICEESKGVWRQFGNSCVDDCRSKFDQFQICADSSAFGCDCGKGRCWNGEFCVGMRDYKKVFDREQEEDQKILSEAKAKRAAAAKENRNAIMTKLTSSVDAPASNPSDPKASQPSNNLAQFYKDKDANLAPKEVVVKDVQKTPEEVAIEMPKPAGLLKVLDTPQKKSESPAEDKSAASKTNPKIPPLFLQQQKAKEEEAAAAAQNKNKNPEATTPGAPTQSNTTSPALPSLPEIPLPN